jgi:hypothetical protein
MKIRRRARTLQASWMGACGVSWLAERILMTADAVGGTWAYSLNLIRRFAADGSEIVLAVPGPQPGDDQRREAGAIRRLSLIELPGRLEWMEEPGMDLELHARALIKLAREFHPAIVHLNAYALASLRFPCPSVVTAHPCPVPAGAAYRSRVSRGLAGADLVIAPSRAVQEEIRTLYRPPAPTIVIPDGPGMAQATRNAYALAAETHAMRLAG